MNQFCIDLFDLNRFYQCLLPHFQLFQPAFRGLCIDTILNCFHDISQSLRNILEPDTGVQHLKYRE